MKYLITESQFNLILEGIPTWIKRRLDKETLSKYVYDSILNFPNPCDEFQDDFHYVNIVIRWAVEDFLLSDESYEWGDDYDSVYDEVRQYVEDLYSPILTKKYREMCHK